MSHFAETKGAFQLPDLASDGIADALLEERAPRPHNFFHVLINRLSGGIQQEASRKTIWTAASGE
jgi:hypothetical protein